MRIIDAHTHPIFAHQRKSPQAIDDLVAHGRAAGLTHMVVLGDVVRHGAFPTEKEIQIINDESADLQRRHPNFFSSLCFINPTLGERAVHCEVARCVTQYGFVGIKLEYCNNARAACMGPVMAAARQLRLPVLQHSWSMEHIRQRRFHSDPEDTAALGRKYPDVTIIMAHLSGCEARGVLEIKELPNVVVDTSGGTPVDGLVEYAVEQLGPERVLYGSDLTGRAATVAIARVTGSGLSASEKRKILHDNAARVFGLD